CHANQHQSFGGTADAQGGFEFQLPCDCNFRSTIIVSAHDSSGLDSASGTVHPWPCDHAEAGGYVLGMNHKLSRFDGNSATPTFGIAQVAQFQALTNNVVYVLGTDHTLRRVDVTSPDGTIVAKQVAQFQALAHNVVYVLGTDHTL